MELFVTTNSPYARLIRALLHELCINDRVIVTLANFALKTARIMRLIHRVPYLVRDDGIGTRDPDLGKFLCVV